MATHDYIISNASGAAVRADLNNALAAIATNNSSATEPTTTYAYQWWADTGSSPTVMKLRNAANSGWITLFQLDGEWTVVPFENGTAAAPSIYFKDSGTDTGIYSPGTDQVGISAGGTSRFEVSTSATTSTLPVVHPLGAVGTPSITFTGDLNTGIWSPAADTVAVSTNGTRAITIDSSQRLGIGTTSAGSYSTYGNKLVIYGTGTDGPGMTIATGTSDTGSIYFADGTTGNEIARGAVQYAHASDALLFQTAATERFRCDSSGRLLVGTSSSPSGGTGQYAKIVTQGYVGSDTSEGVISIQRGTAASSITANQAIGVVTFGDSTGQAFGQIYCYADANAGVSDYPGRLVFSVTSDGSASPSEALRISNDRSIAVTQAPGKYSISTSEGATSIANNGTVDFTSFSGFILANNYTSGAVQCWLAGAGSVTSISSNGGAVGSLAYNAGIGGYRWTNNSGSTATFGFFCVRTRNAA